MTILNLQVLQHRGSPEKTYKRYECHPSLSIEKMSQQRYQTEMDEV